MINIVQSLAAALSTCAFALLFNVRGKNVFYAGVIGGLGWYIYLLAFDNSDSKTFALFLSSFVISLLCEVFARLKKTPVTTFIIAAIIPLVPGNGMYYTMYESINGNFEKAMITGFTTLLNAGTIALGIVLVSSIVRFIFRPKILK